MGFGYADKLSHREDLGGSLGDAEHVEPLLSVESKVQQLAKLVRDSKKIAAFTGAGISTAAGVPDFRGPTGIWTLQRAGLPISKLNIEFGAAKPTVTHQALVALQQTGKLTCVISQNVDGLHTRSGIDREKLAELHGSCFTEKCGRCRREYVRDFELDTVGFKRTGRRCECGGQLRDACLDWENELPEEEYQKALTAVQECDLLLCLGSSLRITPACELPRETVGAGGKLVIINLQATQHDKIAHLHIHAKCEDVIGRVVSLLAWPLPEYKRHDTVKVTFTKEVSFGKNAGGSTGFEISVTSRDSSSHVPPVLCSVDFSFPEEGDDTDDGTVTQPPFRLRQRVTKQHGSLHVRLHLHLSKDADTDKRDVVLDPVFMLGPEAASETGAATSGQRALKRLRVTTEPQSQEFTFLTQHCTFDSKTDESARVPEPEFGLT